MNSEKNEGLGGLTEVASQYLPKLVRSTRRHGHNAVIEISRGMLSVKQEERRLQEREGVSLCQTLFKIIEAEHGKCQTMAMMIYEV